MIENRASIGKLLLVMGVLLFSGLLVRAQQAEPYAINSTELTRTATFLFG